jgi:hypothetical protein
VLENTVELVGIEPTTSSLASTELSLFPLALSRRVRPVTVQFKPDRLELPQTPRGREGRTGE